MKVKAKELKWILKDSDGKVLTWASNRESMRDSKRFYEENIFEFGWLEDYRFPLKIFREEWELVDERVVR
jgi:hypothetical protein